MISSLFRGNDSSANMSYTKRTDHLNTGDQLAIGQEYREWIGCINNKDLTPQNILFINTSTFGEDIK